MGRYISLPNNLKYFLRGKKNKDIATPRMDMSEFHPFLIGWYRDHVFIETESGRFYPSDIDHTLDHLSQHEVNFTFCPSGQLDTVLAHLPGPLQQELALLGEVEIGLFKISRGGHDYLRIERPGRTSHLFNIAQFFKIAFPETLDGVREAGTLLLESRREAGIPTYTFSTPAAETRAIISNIPSLATEIVDFQQLKMPLIDIFHAACYGGRMESDGIGTESQYHYDMVKAHLNILWDYPTTYNLQRIQGRGYNPKAQPTSAYKVSVDVPDKWPFRPLPSKDPEGMIRYKKGSHVGWYYKEYIDLLDELGIPFKVLQSVEYFGAPEYPFRDYVRHIRAVLKFFEAAYPQLDAKHFYYNIAGSCKSIYRSYYKHQYGEYQTPTKMFCPPIYGFVLTRQNVTIYRLALKHNAASIKIDAVGTRERCPELEDPNSGFAMKGKGKTLYVTPSIKTLPHAPETYQYRRVIKKNPEARTMNLIRPSVQHLDSFTSDSIDELSSNATPTPNPHSRRGSKLGQKGFITLKIRPSFGGNREGVTEPHPPQRVGDLLEKWIKSKPNDDPQNTPRGNQWRFPEQAA